MGACISKKRADRQQCTSPASAKVSVDEVSAASSPPTPSSLPDLVSRRSPLERFVLQPKSDSTSHMLHGVLRTGEDRPIVIKVRQSKCPAGRPGSKLTARGRDRAEIWESFRPDCRCSTRREGLVRSHRRQKRKKRIWRAWKR